MNYACYKGVSGSWGAIQFDMKYPDVDKEKMITRPGVIFINACTAIGKNQYDWKNKVIFALSIDELGKLLHFFVSAGEGESLNLVHDSGKGSATEGELIKTMNCFTRDGVLGGMMVTIMQKKDDQTTTHKIPVSGNEVMVLKALFEFAIPRLLGWG